jgi:cell wall-associated NlpC family hydrolase
MPNPDDWIDRAREYIGTPFHFGGRLKGIGVDCGGLLAGVAAEVGLEIEVPPSYSREDSLRQLMAVLRQTCEETQIRFMRAGDILVFSSRRMPGHCGLFTGEGTFIHAYDSPSVQEVVETPLSEAWRERVVKVYRPKGLG